MLACANLPEFQDSIVQLWQLCQPHWVTLNANAGYYAPDSIILFSVLNSTKHLPHSSL